MNEKDENKMCLKFGFLVMAGLRIIKKKQEITFLRDDGNREEFRDPTGFGSEPNVVALDTRIGQVYGTWYGESVGRHVDHICAEQVPRREASKRDYWWPGCYCSALSFG